MKKGIYTRPSSKIALRDAKIFLFHKGVSVCPFNLVKRRLLKSPETMWEEMKIWELVLENHVIKTKSKKILKSSCSGNV